jgi:hypothetical protein
MRVNVLFGKVERIDDHRVEILHLLVSLARPRIIGTKGHVVESIAADHKELAIGILPG